MMKKKKMVDVMASVIEDSMNWCSFTNPPGPLPELRFSTYVSWFGVSLFVLSEIGLDRWK